MSQTILDEVKKFMEQNRGHYQDVLDHVKQVCEGLRETLEYGTIREVYSRADKQRGYPFKTDEKIAKALARERASNSTCSPREITDIIGVTVIVYYNSQIGHVAEKILENLKNFTEKRSDLKKANGYYAHHLVVRSRRGRTSGLHCEIQIKTMLHDSWGAKTHDLNYKPQGSMDARHSRIMQFFGDALQAIEEQSDLMRDIITEGWTRNIEQVRAVREQMFRLVPVDGKAALRLSAAGERIRADIRKLGKAGQGAGAGEVDDIVESILEHAAVSLRDTAWLALYLAMFHLDPEHESIARQRVNDLVPHIERLLKAKEMSEDEAIALPLALEIVDQEDAALELSNYLLGLGPCLSDSAVDVLKFNLANYLVQDCFRGSPKTEAELAGVKDKVEALLADCAGYAAANPSAMADLRGMLVVATSDDPVAVRGAIDLIAQGVQGVNQGDEAFAKASYELNVRIAWRRLLELEDRKAARERLAKRRRPAAGEPPGG